MLRNYKAVTPYSEFTCRSGRELRFIGLGFDSAGELKAVSWAETQSAARSGAGRNWRETGVSKVEVFPAEAVEAEGEKCEKPSAPV